MAEQIFRERAIKAYQDPDTRGPLLQLAPPSVSRLLVSLGLITALLLAGSAFIRVQVIASGRGVLRPEGGVVVVRAPRPGPVRGVDVAVGQEVEAGAVLFRLDAPVLAPVSGVVDALSLHAGEVVAEGALVGKIVPTHQKLVGLLTVPSRYRASLWVGQHVRLGYDEFPWAEMGFGHGHIQRVSEDLVTQELPGAGLVEHESSRPPSYLVEVGLDIMPPGARGSLHNGMSFEGVVPVRTQRVLTLLIKPLARLIGD